MYRFFLAMTEKKPVMLSVAAELLSQIYTKLKLYSNLISDFLGINNRKKNIEVKQ